MMAEVNKYRTYIHLFIFNLVNCAENDKVGNDILLKV